MALQGAALTVAAIGTAAGIQQNRKVQAAQEDTDAIGRAQAEIERARGIRQAVAAGRVQQAQVAASSQAQGAGDSSGAAGGIGSAQTQASANIGFAQTVNAANSAQNAARGRANDAVSRGQTFGAIAALPGQFGFDPKSAAKQIAKNQGFGETA